nr:LysR family transcriptional regulator [Fodinicola feengrottensis]
MRLEARHLRVLCAIADAGSLRKAAVQLGMTQPAITAGLQRIEAALGGPAFLRNADGCRPTPLGQFLVARGRNLLAEMDSLLEAAVGLAADGEHRQLRVGCTPSHVTAGWLERLRSLAPETDVVLHVDNSARTLMGLLDQRQLDVAYLYENEGWSMPPSTRVARRTVMVREPQSVAIASGDPLADAENVTLTDLADSSWVINSSGDDEAAHIRRCVRGRRIHSPAGQYRRYSDQSGADRTRTLHRRLSANFGATGGSRRPANGRRPVWCAPFPGLAPGQRMGTAGPGRV